jgi:hypothetical protein
MSEEDGDKVARAYANALAECYPGATRHTVAEEPQTSNDRIGVQTYPRKNNGKGEKKTLNEINIEAEVEQGMKDTGKTRWCVSYILIQK